MNKVVYHSRSGNTRKIATAIARGAGANAESIKRFDASEDADILFIGASLYVGSIDSNMRTFLSNLNPERVKKAVVFGTGAGKKSALAEIKSILEPKGIIVSEDFFHCNGSFLFSHKGRPNADDLRAAEDFAIRICEEYN